MRGTILILSSAPPRFAFGFAVHGDVSDLRHRHSGSDPCKSVFISGISGRVFPCINALWQGSRKKASRIATGPCPNTCDAF
jgi:hypothetical protein